jgi:nucleotide-binding universal stress UspA family protein
MFDCIVFATDGSDHARKALDYARNLADLHKSRVFIVHVYPNLSDFLGFKDYSDIATQRIANGEKILDEAAEALSSHGLTVETELLEGPTAEAILQVAEVRKADLIILGARGLGTLKGLLLGSVSHKVLQHASCPVLIIH